jgi:hypothetical protein
MSRDEERRFLRTRRAPPHVVEGGLAGLIEAWERTAYDIEGEYPLGMEDYLNDMDGRQLIDDLIVAVPASFSPELRDRLAEADRGAREGLMPADECLWGSAVAVREGWTPERNWWYFNLPRTPGQQMSEELRES